jgi:uncharacterized membrane protein
MDGTQLFNIFMRWLHVASAVVGLGGTVTMRFVVLPALERLPNGAEIGGAVRPAFKRLIHASLGLLLLTGLYNYLVVAMPKLQHLKEQGTPLSGYNGAMGMKILLFAAMFGIAILLLKPVPSFHENRRTWLSVNVVLGLLAVLIGAYLRRLWP